MENEKYCHLSIKSMVFYGKDHTMNNYCFQVDLLNQNIEELYNDLIKLMENLIKKDDGLSIESMVNCLLKNNNLQNKYDIRLIKLKKPYKNIFAYSIEISETCNKEIKNTIRERDLINIEIDLIRNKKKK